AELPTLDRWASKWTNPYDRFASDEDVDFASGHAIDPRVFQFMLTDHPLHWCEGQIGMMRGLMNAVLARFPSPGHAYDEARLAFIYPFTDDLRCSLMAAHTIGGEYLSRSRRTDPHATLPLTAVPRKQEIRAWNLLASELFDNNAWHFNADVLRSLTYSEVSSFTNGTWAYNPTPRHDLPVVETVNAAQNVALNEVFAPLTLQRIDDIHTKYRANSTMSLSDLFTWAQATIFGDIADGIVAHDGVIKRNLQVAFAKRLAMMWLHPMPGTPSDAQALARAELVNLRDATSTGLGRKGLDEMTRAHLEALRALANAALRAHMAVGGAPTMLR
ncbi:MAG: zinc-dependent metalloprotease, partial [Candidatus Eremiobacteraeota bacterium]|nr:zinc-dependent metalloprotease [Candidatus Eremiobacteraeota bacterium]